MNQDEPKRNPQPATAIHQQCLTVSALNPFINGRGLIYLGISKMSFTF